MKKQLWDALPFSLKLFLKRLLVGLVGSAVRFAARVTGLADKLLNVAIKNGLDIEEARTRQARRITPTVSPWSSHDLLLFMNAVSDTVTRSSDDPPRVSIIIPVFNNVEHTFQCLRSLFQEIDLNDTEIIVVNNASRDETERVLSYLSY